MKSMNHLLYRTMRTSLPPLPKPDAIRLLMCCGLIGVAAGVLLCRRIPVLGEYPILMQGLAISKDVRTLWDVLRNALLPMPLLLGGVLLCGTSALGQPFAILLLLLRGISTGIALSDCFAHFPVQQALFAAAALILPYAYLSLLLTAHAVKDAIHQACRLTRFLFTPERPPADDTQPHRFWLYFLLTIPAAGLHTALIWLLNDRVL